MIEEVKKNKVSFSQFSNWFNCPHRWYLDFVKGLRIFDDSVHTCFGDAIHEAIQLYIETLYKEGAVAADNHDLIGKFKLSFKKYLVERKIKITDEDISEFMSDGKEIIESFSNLKNRIKHFPSNKYEFIGIEDEIIIPVKNNVEFVCYIDVVLKEKSTGRYRIIDIKTSTYEWNSYKKEDPSKFSQVLLYKAFFSKKYNVPLNMIDVEFFILKRKLYENVGFPQSRIQTFSPKQNEKEIKNVLSLFSQFIGECYKPDGNYNENRDQYPKIPGKNKKNCKFCPHKKINCDTKSDLTKEELD